MARILVGVTGSVAAIKTTELIENLGGKGYELRLVMTRAAEFFLPEWENVRPVDRVPTYRDRDEWPASGWQRGDEVLHIELRRWADAFLIAPLDAHTLAKWANGFADNLMTSVIRCWDYEKPLLVAPAMNSLMWESPITRRHFAQILCDRRAMWPGHGALPEMDEIIQEFKLWKEPIRIIPPVEKALACGDVGMGGMASVANIIEHVREFMPPNLAME